MCWTRGDDRGTVVPECDPVHQLPRLPFEEELAERACALHQDHHGQVRENLLDNTMDYTLHRDVLLVNSLMHIFVFVL